MVRRRGNEITDFPHRCPHGCRFRPPDEPVAKYTAIVRGQSARVYNRQVREGVVSGNEQRDPVQVIALLSERRLDFTARRSAALGPSCFRSVE